VPAVILDIIRALDDDAAIDIEATADLVNPVSVPIAVATTEYIAIATLVSTNDLTATLTE
jgi:hypothetical protein